MDRIILASQSPRRKELLEKAGYQIEIYPPKLSEILNKNLSLDRALIDIARQKTRAFAEQFSGQFDEKLPVLTSDTMVILDGEALGKPKDREQAKEYLFNMSGRSHEVKTAILLTNFSTDSEAEAIVTTKVYFKSLSEQEVEAYLDSMEWTDKAGAYGIQGKAKDFVQSLDGSLDNVIGLPIEVLPDLLEKLNNA